jgi:hypothetical protein
MYRLANNTGCVVCGSNGCPAVGSAWPYIDPARRDISTLKCVDPSGRVLVGKFGPDQQNRPVRFEGGGLIPELASCRELLAISGPQQLQLSGVE